MADYPTAPSTPLGPVSSANIDNLTNDPVVPVPAAPHKQAKNHTVLQIRTRSSTLPTTSSHSHHHVQTGRVTKTKPPSILRSSTTNPHPKKHRNSNLHVRFEDLPSRSRSMAPSPTTPPRTPPPSFEEDTIGFNEAPSTPEIMPEPSTPPPAPHMCMTEYGDECRKCKRVERWNRDATLAIGRKQSPSKKEASGLETVGYANGGTRIDGKTER